MIGPNGAGKSTALKAICGLLNPRSGEVLFQGENINGKQPYQLVEKGLCLVPEGRRLFTSMRVLENLEMGAYTVSSGQLSAEKTDNRKLISGNLLRRYSVYFQCSKKGKNKKQEP
jgi:branched-chain amino acid transport system ATP-binding protein